jgi:hypothetical protein
MARSAEQTTNWVAQKISEMQGAQADVIGPTTIRINRMNYPPFLAAIIAVRVVTAEVLQPLLDANSSIEIVVNIPKESMWTGSAIASAVDRGIAFGGLSDLMTAVNSAEDVSAYIRKEYAFVERGLRQHSRVLSWDREFDRVYLVHRYQLPSFRFVMLNEYELTTDHVRTARDRYGAFDAILINNPNGKPTSGADELAESLDIGIFLWAEFFGRLNHV